MVGKGTLWWEALRYQSLPLANEDNIGKPLFQFQRMHYKYISWYMVNDSKQERENGDFKKNRDLWKPAAAIIWYTKINVKQLFIFFCY